MAIASKYSLNGNSNDSAGSNNGTASNVTYGAGKSGEAGGFNGTNSKIETNRTVPNNNNVTFRCSIFDTSTNNTSGRIVIADSGGGFFIFQSNRPSPNNNGRASFNIFSGSDRQILETVTHSKNQWYRYVGVLTGGIMYLYKNGVLQGSLSCGNISNITNGLDFGTNNNTGWFQGKIDEIDILNHGMSYSEVKNDYLYLNGFF